MTDDTVSRIDALERRLLALEDERGIREVQYTYGYYCDHGLSEAVASLFAEDGEIEIGRRGVYRGPKRVEEFIRLVHREGQGPLKAGEAIVHLQTQGRITLAEDGESARARFRAFNLIATKDDSGEITADSFAATGASDDGMEKPVYAFMSEGAYENEYVKVDGAWKIKRLHWIGNWYVPFNEFRDAWYHSAGPSESCPPDEANWDLDMEASPRPIIPFHWAEDIRG